MARTLTESPTRTSARAPAAHLHCCMRVHTCSLLAATCCSSSCTRLSSDAVCVSAFAAACGGPRRSAGFVGDGACAAGIPTEWNAVLVANVAAGPQASRRALRGPHWRPACREPCGARNTVKQVHEKRFHLSKGQHSTSAVHRESRKCLWFHRESVSGLGGFRLGFVHDPPRLGGSGLYQNALILYHLTTARGLGGWRTQRFGVLYSKFEFAVQDAIKTPKLKPPQPETLSR